MPIPKLPLTPLGIPASPLGVPASPLLSALQSDYAGGRYGRAATTPEKPIAPNTFQGELAEEDNRHYGSALQAYRPQRAPRLFNTAPELPTPPAASPPRGTGAGAAPARMRKQSSATPHTPLTPFQFGYKLASYSNSAGLGALAGAGLGGLAGLVAPGETSSGKRRGRLSGALRGALAGGAAGGLGGLGVEGLRQSPAAMAQINALRARLLGGKPHADMTAPTANGAGKLDSEPLSDEKMREIDTFSDQGFKPRQDATMYGVPHGPTMSGVRPKSPDLGPLLARSTMEGVLNPALLAKLQPLSDEKMREIDTFSNQGFKPRQDATYSPTPPVARPRYLDSEDLVGGLTPEALMALGASPRQTVAKK